MFIWIQAWRDAMPKVIPMPGWAEKVVAERDQLSHGRLIHVVSYKSFHIPFKCVFKTVKAVDVG